MVGARSSSRAPMNFAADGRIRGGRVVVGLETTIPPDPASQSATEMTVLKVSISVLWAGFWIYWLISAASAKRGSRTGRTRAPGLLVIILVLLLTRIFNTDTWVVRSAGLEIFGLVLVIAGLGFAVWARIHLGRNWGMPMTRKDEPELVTSGPYHFVRHPIYSGILLATLGTGVATYLYWFIVFGVLAVYFVYSARVEEKLMAATFPRVYPSYRAKTKMLIPFVF
jgi:protein-S-isoprenylcysteine O-methyltransferase Ste14